MENCFRYDNFLGKNWLSMKKSSSPPPFIDFKSISLAGICIFVQICQRLTGTIIWDSLLIFRYHECHSLKIDRSNRFNQVVLLTQTGQSTKIWKGWMKNLSGMLVLIDIQFFLKNKNIHKIIIILQVKQCIYTGTFSDTIN